MNTLVRYFNIGVSVLFVLHGIPLIFKLVGPNTLFGFRTVKTLSDPDIWFAVNRVMGFDLLIGGVVLFGVAASTIVMSERFSTHAASLLNVLAIVGIAVAVFLHCSYVLKKM
jgi:uncharacterized membrane protein